MNATDPSFIDSNLALHYVTLAAILKQLPANMYLQNRIKPTAISGIAKLFRSPVAIFFFQATSWRGRIKKIWW